MIKWEQSWQTIGAVPMWCFLHSAEFTWNKANTFHMVFMIANGTRYLLCMGKYMSVANGTIIHLYPIDNLSLPCDKPWCRTGIYKNIPSESLLEITHIHDHIDSGVNKHKTKQWTQQWSWLQPQKHPFWWVCWWESRNRVDLRLIDLEITQMLLKFVNVWHIKDWK